jgi:hypothetical protein
MQFYISPRIEGRQTRLKVKLIFRSELLEKFEVTARNKSLTLQTNRLLFLSKGLKHRRGQWTLIAGSLHNQYALDMITKAIDEKLSQK